MQGPPGSPPAVCRGGGPSRLCLHQLRPPRNFPGEAVPWDAPVCTTRSGMSPLQRFGGHRAWVTPRDTWRGQTGTAWPEVQLRLQGCAGLSGTKQLGQEMQSGELAAPTGLGCCCPVALVDRFLCRSCRQSAAGQRCLQQVCVLSSHTPSGFRTGFGYPVKSCHRVQDSEDVPLLLHIMEQEGLASSPRPPHFHTCSADPSSAASLRASAAERAEGPCHSTTPYPCPCFCRRSAALCASQAQENWSLVRRVLQAGLYSHRRNEPSSPPCLSLPRGSGEQDHLGWCWV